MTSSRDSFDALLAEYLKLHAATPALGAFHPCPVAPAPQRIVPHRIPAATLMERDAALDAPAGLAPLRDAFIAASPHAQWRETYRDSGIAGDFLDRFACYCLVGEGGPYATPGMSAYVVYMPAGLTYPFHHHPAEEIYFLLAGQARFRMQGQAPRLLGPGDHVFHPSNVPHATETLDRPFMALVLWRGDIGVKPVFTDRAGSQGHPRR